MALADALLLEACPLDVWIALRRDGAKGSCTENDPFNGAPRYEPALSVTQLTCSGRTATATTSVAHGYSQWDVVTISGVTGSGVAYYNDTFVIDEIPDATHFSYWMRHDSGASGAGTITCAGTFYQFDERLLEVGTNKRILNTRVGGPYHDTWSSRDLIVRNNHYRNVVNGPYQALGNVGNLISASSVTFGDPDNYTAKFTTVAPHGFTARQAVRISGVMVGQGVSPLYNGYFRIESVSSDWFTYRMTDNPGSNANTGTGQVEALFETGRCVIENNIIEIIPSYMSWGLPEAISFRMWGWQDPAFADVNPRIYRQLVQGYSGGVKQNELTTLIEDATSLAWL